MTIRREVCHKCYYKFLMCEPSCAVGVVQGVTPRSCLPQPFRGGKRKPFSTTLLCGEKNCSWRGVGGAMSTPAMYLLQSVTASGFFTSSLPLQEPSYTSQLSRPSLWMVVRTITGLLSIRLMAIMDSSIPVIFLSPFFTGSLREGGMPRQLVRRVPQAPKRH